MKQYAPRIEVLHHGLVSGSGTRDITDWLGEGCTISTSKSIREPMGQFSIVFADKRLDDSSLYALFAPMDAIEIRVAHDGSQAKKLIMRGFISDVRREKAMGQDGRPQRRVTVIGHDVGKLMIMHRIIVFPCLNMREAALNLSKFGPLVKYFGDASPAIPADVYLAAFTEVLNEHLRTLTAQSKLSNLTLAPSCTAEGVVPTYPMASETDITYFDHMRKYLDVGPFNELFTRDWEGGAQLVCRPNFFDAARIAVTEEDVQFYQVHRTDADIGNWFWANQLWAPLVDQVSLKQSTAILGCNLGNARDWLPCREEIYGWRPIQVDMRLFPPEYSGAHAPRRKTRDADIDAVMAWTKERVNTLRDNNVYNALHEHAVFRVSGNEHAQAGTWVDFTEGEIPSEHYCHRVEHEFQMYGNYVTTLHCDKGTGYLARMGGSHYKAELNLKGALK